MKTFLLATAIALLGTTSTVYALPTINVEAFVIKPSAATAQYEVNVAATKQFESGIYIGAKLRYNNSLTKQFDIQHYYIGKTFDNTMYVSVGAQDNIFKVFTGGLTKLGSTALATPVAGSHSIIAGIGSHTTFTKTALSTSTTGTSAIALEFNRATRSAQSIQAVTYINTQYTFINSVAFGVDHQFATAANTFAVTAKGAIGAVNTSLTATYANAAAVDVGAEYNGVSTFIAVTKSKITDVGVGYKTKVANATLWGDVVRNTATKTTAIAAGVGFSF